MNKLKLSLLITVLLVSGVALAQVFLGPMFRLGYTTTAGRPTPSTTVEGSLLYDTDIDQPIYATSGAWNTFSSGALAIWLDGGAFQDDMPASQQSTYTDFQWFPPDGGAITLLNRAGGTSASLPVGVVVKSSRAASGNRVSAALSFAGDNDQSYGCIYGASYASISTRQGLTLTAGCGGSGTEIGFSSGAAGNAGTYIGGFTNALNGNGGLQMNQSSGFDSFRNLTTGARIHLSNAGSNDYFVSDGTGIESPGYIESTQAFSAGPGLLASRVQATGGASSDFTTSAATAGAAGAMSWNSSRGQMYTQVSSSRFAPIAQPHLVTDKQVISTRVFGGSAANAPPQIAERVVVGAAGTDTLQSYWTSTAGNSTTTATIERAAYALTTSTADNNRQYWTVASSAATTTMLPITDVDASPQFCQRLTIFTTITNMRVFTGLVAALPSGATATLDQTGAVFRYDTSVDGLLYLCTRDSTTQGCTSTGVTVAADTEYLLCMTFDSSRNVYGWVNGVHLASRTSNLPVANTKVAPFTSVENISGGSAKTLLVGVTQLEMQ